jgi:hypothetical protein
MSFDVVHRPTRGHAWSASALRVELRSLARYAACADGSLRTVARTE